MKSDETDVEIDAARNRTERKSIKVKRTQIKQNEIYKLN